MGGRKNANIDGRRVRRPDRAHRPLLQDAQQFDLERKRHVADFIEEQCAAIIRFEQADMVATSAGKRPTNVPAARGLARCIARARSSLPVPLSPRISSLASELAITLASAISSAIRLLR